MAIYIVTIGALLIDITFILLIKRNNYNMYIKRKYGEVIPAQVKNWRIFLGTPTRYIIQVEYETKNEKTNKTLITSGKFARKYEKEKSIKLVEIPNSNKIFFEEEDRKVQNIVLTILSVVMTLCVGLLLFMCMFY